MPLPEKCLQFNDLLMKTPLTSENEIASNIWHIAIFRQISDSIKESLRRHRENINFCCSIWNSSFWTRGYEISTSNFLMEASPPCGFLWARFIYITGNIKSNEDVRRNPFSIFLANVLKGFWDYQFFRNIALCSMNNRTRQARYQNGLSHWGAVDWLFSNKESTDEVTMKNLWEFFCALVPVKEKTKHSFDCWTSIIDSWKLGSDRNAAFKMVIEVLAFHDIKAVSYMQSEGRCWCRWISYDGQI